MVLRILGVELFGDVLGGAFTRGCVNIHCCRDVGVTEGVLQILRLDFLFDGDCGVALADGMCRCGNADITLVVSI